MSEYRIELGVKLNTSEIRSQVSKYNGNSNNAKLKLGVKLDTKGISNQIRAINSKTPVKVSLKLDTKNAQSQINNIKKQIQQLGNIKINLGGTSVNSRIGSGQNVTQDTVNKLKKSYKELLTMANQISNLEAKIGKLKFAGNNTKQIEVLESKLKSLKVTYDSLANSFINKGALTSGVFDVGDLSNLNNAVNQGKIKLNELEAEYEDTRIKLARKLEINLQEGKFSAQVAKINGDVNKLSNVSNELRTKLNMLNSAESAMNSAFKNGSVEQKIQAYNNYKRTLESVRNQLKQNQIAEQTITNVTALNQAKQNLSLKMSNWLRDNSAATKQFGGEIKNLQAQLKKCGNMSAVNNVSKAFNNVALQAKAAGVATQSLSDKIKTQFSKYSSYLSVASVFMYTTQALRSMFEQVKLIDSAMTELKKVTDETASSYDKFLSNAASRAKEIGTTIDGLVSSTADFARLGYNFKDSQGLAEVANIYAVVGDEVEGVEGATESLISTMAAFKDEAEGVSNTDFATSIIDKFNEIGNKFAISSGGIGEAMKRSASSLDAANNSIDESIALITAANTVVQNPDKVGNAFKTISMRIRGAKTELEEAGESTEGMAESTASMRKEIMALSGVDIMLNENTFKSTYQIMDELADKWEGLSDIAQASIIELMAGKHQGNVFASLMSNFDTAREALEVSANSAGSAMAEHAKWSESLEARLLKLKATWQSLAQSFMKSDFLKGLLNGVIGLVDGLDKLISTFGTLPTFLTMFSAFKSFGGGGFFRTIQDEATGAATGITNVFKQSANSVNQSLSSINVKTGFRGFLDNNDISALRNYSNALNKGVSSGTAWNNCMSNASDVAKEVAKSNEFLSKGLNGYIKSQQSAEISTIAQNKSLTNAKAIIKEYQSGCKNCGMSQKDFANAVSKTNPQLATQLTTAKSANGAMAGYIVSLVGAKVASIALQAATMALNMALTMGVAAAVSFAIKKFDEWYVSASELAEKVEEVTSKYKEQHDALMKVKGDYDTSNEDSMISKYGELSKGVNSLGENISLTADEYAEYQSIVGTIAEQIPNLVTGYNSQGDAILSCAGNVDTLAESYKNLVKEQNREVLKTGEDILKDFNNDMEDVDGSGYLKALQDIFESEDIESAINDLSGQDAMKISELLEENGIERDVIGSGKAGFESYKEHIIRAVKDNASEIKSALSDAFNDVNAHIEDLNAYTEAYFSTAFLGGDGSIGDYSGFSDKMQNIISQVTSGFDASFYEQFNSIEELEKYFNTMLTAFDNLGSGEKKKLEASFDLQTQFNSGKVSYGEYVKGIQDAGKIIDSLGLDEEVANQLKLSLNTEEVAKNYESLTNRLVEISTKDLKKSGHFSGISDAMKMATEDAKKFLDGLTASEYAVAVDLIVNGEIDLSDFNIDSLRKYIEDQAKLNEAMNFTIAIDAETEGVEAFNTAMAESVSATGLSSTSIATLKSRYAELAEQGYDLSSMFEETSNGIHLNRNAVNEFEQALASQKLSETEGHLNTLKGEYDNLTEKINNCTDAGERANLYNEQQTIAQKINDLATLASQYEGLTSAYNAWQNAESTGSERDMYENILSGFETVEDELSRGWTDDGTIKFLELLTGRTDLAGKSAKELKEVYKGLDKEIKNTSYSVKDFFTVDEDGNSTSQGVYNFLDAVGQLEEEKFGGKDVVKRDKDGNIISFDFQVAGGDKAIADALGISEELVQIMKRAADDAGFVVTIDGKWTQLADLKTSAEESGNALKKLRTEGLEELKDFSNEDLTFNFDASSLEELNTEFEKANNVLDKFKDKNGQIKTDKNGNMVKGAKEALEVASYYQATIDKLTEPVYMQLETNQVEENLQEPLTKMQEFERLSKEKHQLKLAGDTEGLKDVEAEMDEIAKYLDNLDEETKIDLEIDGLTQEEIKDKLEKGEIEIPATVDIQLEMSEDIKDMRLLMMNELGLVSDNEIKLKIGYEIDDSLVDKLTDEEKEVVIKYIEENEDAWNELSEEDKEVFIELVASGVDLETLTNDETKEVIIDFVTKNEDEFDKLTDEEKEVVVDLVADDSALKALEEHGVEIEAFCHIFGVEKVDDLKAKLDGLTDKQIQVLAQTLGQINVEKLKTTVAGLDDKTVQAIAKALGEGDVNGLKTTINGLDDKTVQAIAEALGYSDVSELNSAIDNLDPKTVQAIAEALGITDVDSLRNAINRLSDKDVEAVANVSGKDDVDALKSSLNNLKGKTITVWAEIKKKASNLWDKLTGGGGVDGTAHVNGTAFADGTANRMTIKKSGRAFKQGSWGTKDSGVALGGELAPELLVRNGRWHLIGEKGAEFFGYKKDDIIFNADQTREIFEKGKITHGNGRGKALVSGTAFADGTESKTIIVGTNNNTGKSYTKSSDTDSSKDFEETFDLVEIAISRVERAIDKLDLKANSVYKSWSSRNNALSSEINKVGEEINLQEKAANEYLSAANGVGLSSDWIKKIQNGQVDITTVKDEVLAEKIKDYQTYYELYLDCIDAAEELRETEAKLYAQRFENVQTQYDAILQGYEHTEAMLNEYIAQAEEQGYVVSKKYYQALINNEKANISELKKEQSDLIAKRDEAVESGAITRGSEEWYNMCAEIDSVTQAIEEGQTELLEYDNAMREIDWSVFDLIQERISAINEEADFLIELMNNNKLFDDNGKLTSQGMATIGLHGQKYNDYMYQADEYGAEVSKLNAQIAKDPYDQELINRRNELLELQRESILAAEDEKEAIRDMVEEGINLELDALQERIDLYNEAMDFAKDLYDYQKKVEEQTSEIADLRKQESAYLGDTSEEGKAKLQEIRMSLEEAESDLEETEYDKYITDQAKLLDSLYVEYETILNTRLDNIDYLLEQMIAEINASALGVNTNITTELGNTATTIKTTLETEAKNVGTTLSTAMSNIWTVGDGNIKSVLSTYGKGFQDKQTSTNVELGKIKADVNAMVDDVDKDAKKKVTENKTTTSAKKNPTTSSSSSSNKNNITKPTNTTNKTTSSGDGKPKVGDKVKFVSGKYYYDSEGKSPLGSQYQGKEVYITHINTASWATHPYHISTGKKLGSGDLGWLKLNQISGYVSGKKNFLSDEVAWTQENGGKEFIVRPSDGAILTPIAKGDSVLNAIASRNIWDMANSPTDFIKNNLGLDNANIPNGANVNNNVVQNFENIVFSMPNVHSYNELLTQMQKDKNFEKLVLSMSVDRLAGKSSLAKNKAIR